MKLYEYWKNLIPAADVFAISATEKFNIGPIFDRILELLPEAPAYFPKDEITDRNDRFFVSEIIREKILLYYQKEIPYSVEVQVEEFKEEENILRVRCVINVVRDSQKGIIIGHKGAALKKSGYAGSKRYGGIFPEKSIYAVVCESC